MGIVRFVIGFLLVNKTKTKQNCNFVIQKTQPCSRRRSWDHIDAAGLLPLARPCPPHHGGVKTRGFCTTAPR